MNRKYAEFIAGRLVAGYRRLDFDGRMGFSAERFLEENHPVEKEIIDAERGEVSLHDYLAKQLDRKTRKRVREILSGEELDREIAAGLVEEYRKICAKARSERRSR